MLEKDSGHHTCTEEKEELHRSLETLSKDREELQETVELLRQEKQQLRRDLEDRMETVKTSFRTPMSQYTLAYGKVKLGDPKTDQLCKSPPFNKWGNVTLIFLHFQMSQCHLFVSDAV